MNNLLFCGVECVAYVMDCEACPEQAPHTVWNRPDGEAGHSLVHPLVKTEAPGMKRNILVEEIRYAGGVSQQVPNGNFLPFIRRSVHIFAYRVVEAELSVQGHLAAHPSECSK